MDFCLLQSARGGFSPPLAKTGSFLAHRHANQATADGAAKYVREYIHMLGAGLVLCLCSGLVPLPLRDAQVWGSEALPPPPE